MCEELENHSSLANKREIGLTLEECLHGFSQRYMHIIHVHVPALHLVLQTRI